MVRRGGRRRWGRRASSIYINPALPQPLKIPSSVASERSEGGERIAQLKFRDMSEGVVDLLEKLISASPSPRRRRSSLFT